APAGVVGRADARAVEGGVSDRAALPGGGGDLLGRVPGGPRGRGGGDAPWARGMQGLSSAVVLGCFALRLAGMGSARARWRDLWRPGPVAAVVGAGLALALVSARLAAGVALLHDGWLLVRFWRRHRRRTVRG